MFDVIIIGGGPAGFAAGLYAARAKLETLIIEKAFTGGQMAITHKIDNYPGFEDPVDGFEVGARMENQARRFGAQVINDEVIEVSLEGPVKKVKTRSKEYETKTIILSMGGSPRQLGLSNEDQLRGLGVSYCATCDGAFYRDKTVAIVGGGDTAAEDALFMVRLAKKVYLIHRKDTMRAVRTLQDLVLASPSIEFLWNSTVEKLTGEEELTGLEVKNVITGETQHVAVDGIFVAVGYVPNSDVVKGKLTVDDSGYIITDENMLTNIPGVYAVGDIRQKILRQVITAASDGAVGAYMADKYITSGG